MFGKRGIVNIDVRDALFENVFSEYVYEFTKAELRKIVKNRTPELHEKLKELNKKLTKARESWDRKEYEEIKKQIEVIKKKIHEKTKKEQIAIQFTTQQIRKLRKERRDYFKALITPEIVNECVKVVVENPEKLPAKVGEVLYGEAMAEDGKGAMGSE